jgi:hypothetical protein
MMQRRHFIALAQALADVRPGNDQPVLLAQWFACQIAVSRVLARDNERFNSERFLSACDVSRDLGPDAFTGLTA